MIKNPRYFHEWEKKLIAATAPDFEQNLRIFNMLLEEARMLGVLSLKDPLNGIDDTIRLARIINGLKYPPEEMMIEKK